MTKRAADIGLIPIESPSVAGINDYIKSERVKWGALVDKIGLQGLAVSARATTRMAGRLQDKVALVTGAGCVGPGLGQRPRHRGSLRAGRRKGLRGGQKPEDHGRNRREVPRGRASDDHNPRVRRDRQRLGHGDGRGLHEGVRPHRRSGQQRRRLGRRRPGGDGGGGVRRADRLQPQERVPHLQARAADHGAAGRRRDHQSGVDLGHCAGPARRRSATPPRKPA